MHKSRLAGFILDCRTPDLQASARILGRRPGGWSCASFRQKKAASTSGWWVMEAPTGQRFCVVRSQSPGFADQAKAWTDPEP